MVFCGCKKGILALGLFGSGFAGLGYQMVWTKQLGALFGLEAPAILAVVAAYMGGLTTGALFAESAVLRRLSPIGRFAFLEWIIGLWGLVSYFGLPFLERIPSLTGTGASLLSMLIFFAVIFVALLPATLAMGAVLPVAERIWRRAKPGKERVGWIYGVYTAGAAFGALATAFFLIPEFGLKASLGFLCGLSFLIAIGIFALRRQFPPAGESLAPKSAEAPLRQRAFFTAFGLGFLGIAYQLLCVRVLSQTLENTVYTYASILSVYLAGSSVGALLWQRLANRNPRAVGAAKDRRRSELFRHGLLATAFLIGISLHAMAWVPAWHDALWPGTIRGRSGLLIVEVLVSGLVLFLPAAAMGGLLSHLLQASARPRKGIGATLSGNLLGASLAPAVLVALLPALGAQRFLILISLAYAGLIPPQGLKARWWGIAALGLGLAATPSPAKVLGFSTEEERQTILIREGVSALVSVTTDADGHKALQVNRRFQMGSTRAAADERRQAHLPLLLHPRPERALLLGVGTGITLGAVLEHSQLQADAVELLPEIIQTLPEFAPHNHSPYPPGSIALHQADARRFVRRSRNFYDVIIADVFHPARDGAGLLYTTEHYQNVRDRLAPGGIFCQWLPLRQLDENTLKAIVRTFNAAFPHSSAWLLRDTVAIPVIGLIGANLPLPISPARLTKDLQNPTLRRALQECRLHSAERILGSHLAKRNTLEQFSQSAPLNTDDNQYVASRAPLIRLSNPAPILKTILQLQAQTASSLADDLPPGNLRQKMQTWFPARDLYLLGLADEWAGNRTEAVHKFLQSLSVHKDFPASYAKCITLASQSRHSNPDFSRWLLSQLTRLKPEEPLAQKMLERLRE